MVVGQHLGMRASAARRCDSSRIRWRVAHPPRQQLAGKLEVERRRHLQVLAARRKPRRRGRPRARSAMRRRSRRRAPRPAPRSARSSAARRKTCGVCTAHRPRRSSVSSTPPSIGQALDRVGDGSGRDRRIGALVPRERREHLARDRRRQQRPGGVVHEHRIADPRDRPARSAPTPSVSRRPPRRSRSRPAPWQTGAGGQRDDDLLDLRHRRERLRATTRASGARRARPAPSGARAPRRSPLPAATISAIRSSRSWPSQTATVAHAPGVPPPLERARKPVTRPLPRPSGWWPSRRAARRGSSRPPPRPCRARTSARRRGSSSRA